MPHKLYKNQNGFSLVEGLLVVIAIALVVFVGYYVYHSQKTTNNTYTSASKVAQSSPAKTTKKSTTPTTPTPTVSTEGDLIAYGNKLYGTYFARLKAGSSQSAALAAVKSYFSSSAYAKLTASPALLTCTNDVPASYEVTAFDDQGHTLPANAPASSGELNFTPTDRKNGSAVLNVSVSPLEITDVSCPN